MKNIKQIRKITAYLTGLLPAAKHCRKAEPPPFRVGSFTREISGLYRFIIHDLFSNITSFGYHSNQYLQSVRFMNYSYCHANWAKVEDAPDPRHQGRSRSRLLRAFDNAGDGVSSAFPKGKQNGILFYYVYLTYIRVAIIHPNLQNAY